MMQYSGRPSTRQLVWSEFVAEFLSFLSLSLYNFVEITSLCNTATFTIDKSKLFFSSGFPEIVWCFYLCFYCCARTFRELLRKRIETSTALREGLIEAQPAGSFLPVYQIRVRQLVAKLQRELMYLVCILIRVISTCSVTPEADDFFGIRWSWVHASPK